MIRLARRRPALQWSDRPRAGNEGVWPDGGEQKVQPVVKGGKRGKFCGAWGFGVHRRNVPLVFKGLGAFQTSVPLTFVRVELMQGGPDRERGLLYGGGL